MKRDTLIYIIIAILTVGFSISAVIVGVNLHSRAIAKKQLKSQTEAIITENEHLKSRQEILTSDINSKTDSSDERDKLNTQIADLKEDIKNTELSIKSKTDTKNQLTAKINDVKKVVDKLDAGVNLKRGNTLTLKDTTVLSGDKLKPGRYVATGDGKFSVSSILGGTTISEDLFLLSGYTFDLEEGDRISVHGSVSFTELK
ncbi:MAG: hypothetical protein IJT23_04745 [Clostridia bacterium]|nr:hypothetical protein [Clostridia bacterium]